jgi:glutamine cyclotransferase
VGFIYDTAKFTKVGEFTIPSAEGWGMTTDGHSLIMSDGTSQLTWLDPATMQVTKTLPVSDNDGLIDKLNELEYINGFIYANVYTTAAIVKIDPSTGKVVGQLDLFSLANEAVSLYSGSMEMNGIAYDSATRKAYITGKMWPKVYEIEFGL